MKKIYSVIAICLFSFSACNVLDVEDLGNYGPENVWNDEKLASAYLTDLYAKVLPSWPRDGGNSDECIGILGKDAVQTNNGSFKFWPYTNIRSVNVLLQKIEKGTISQNQKNVLKGQALNLRAYLYFKTVMYHGGVPIIKEPQAITDDLLVKRNSTAECFDFILEDLNAAMTFLPARFSGNNYGRIDQCVVAAFKGRVLLYKASPQFNPGNPYDNSFWEDAYQANKDALVLLDNNGLGLLDNYTAVFETKKHKEAILPVIFINPSKTNGRGEDAVRPLSESKNATGGDQPIWSFVEAFPMKDGKKPGESDKYTYDVQSFWKNRDPRLEANVVWNGAIYELSGKTGRRQYTTPNIANSLDAFGPNIQGEWHQRTGLYCKKGIMEQLPSTQVTLNDVDWLEIRYAEVLFNYAEAANERGKTDVGYDVLKKIRKRAGIEAGADNSYGLKSNMTREEMRMALLDEKRVEFCFEGHRFWDLRRYRMLHTYLNGMHKFGVLATVNGDISPAEAMAKAAKYELLPEDFVYEIKDLVFQNPKGESAMSTPESYYFFPINKSEIEKNPNLEQNKDWGGAFKPELQ